MALAFKLVGDWLRVLTSKMVWPLKTRGNLYSRWFSTDLRAESRRTEEFGFFLVIMESVTADGSLRSPTGGVEGLNPAPHIHEQMTTSNYGYDIAYNFTHNNIMLEHNAMNNMNTVAHMDVHNTQYWAHCAPPIDAQWCHIAPVAQVRLARVIPSMHVHLCVASWLFLLISPVFYFVPLFSFQPFLMFTSEFNERSRSNPLCDFRLGTVVTSDYETHLTEKASPIPLENSTKDSMNTVEKTTLNMKWGMTKEYLKSRLKNYKVQSANSKLASLQTEMEYELKTSKIATRIREKRWGKSSMKS